MQTPKPLTLWLNRLASSSIAFLVVTTLSCDTVSRESKEAFQHIENNLGELFLTQFGNSCPSKGRWSDMAIEQTKSLKATIEALKAKDECKPFHSQLTSVIANVNRLQNVVEDTTTHAIEGHSQNILDLHSNLSKLESFGGSAEQRTQLKAALESTLLDEQIKLIKAKSEVKVSSQSLTSDNLRSARKDFSDVFAMIGKDVGSMGACLTQSPAAAFQIATQLMAIGGNTYAPNSGDKAGVIAQLFSYGLQYNSVDAQVARAMLDTQKNVVPMGLSCLLESMTELYCQVEDSRELLELQAKAYKNQDEISPEWRGMDLLNRRLPVMVDFLRRIRNGYVPFDEADASRQNNAQFKVMTLDQVKREVLGVLNKRAGELEDMKKKGSTQSDEYDVISAVLIDVAGKLTQRGSPFAQVTTDDKKMACMLTVDPTGLNCPTISMLDPIENYTRPLAAKTSFAQIQENLDKLYKKAELQVNTEFTRQIIIDPKLTVVSAGEPSLGNVSPIQAFKMTLIFLEDLQAFVSTHHDVDWNPTLDAFLVETKQILGDTINDLQSSTKPDQVVIGDIIRNFKLRIGVQFFTDRVRKLVEWDLNRRMASKQFAMSTVHILSAAGDEITDRLGMRTTQLDLARLDMDSAQSTVQANLASAHEFLHGHIKDTFTSTIRRLAYASKQANEGDGSNNANKQLLAKICILSAISTPEPLVDNYMGASGPFSGLANVGSEQYNSFCAGTVLESIYGTPDNTFDPKHKMRGINKPNQSLRISYDELFRTHSGLKSRSELPTFANKVCTYHRFLRASRMVETLPTKDSALHRLLMQ